MHAVLPILEWPLAKNEYFRAGKYCVFVFLLRVKIYKEIPSVLHSVSDCDGANPAGCTHILS